MLNNCIQATGIISGVNNLVHIRQDHAVTIGSVNSPVSVHHQGFGVDMDSERYTNDCTAHESKPDLGLWRQPQYPIIFFRGIINGRTVENFEATDVSPVLSMAFRLTIPPYTLARLP